MLRGFADEIVADLPHGTGAHHHNQIAILRLAVQEIADIAKVINRTGVGAARIEFGDEIRGRNQRALDFTIAHEVNRRHDDQIGARKTLRKLFEQESRAAVLMWLKDTDDATRVLCVAQRRQCSFALGWMMTIVVEDTNIRAISSDTCAEVLHPSIDAVETL